MSFHCVLFEHLFVDIDCTVMSNACNVDEMSVSMGKCVKNDDARDVKMKNLVFKLRKQ